MAMTQDLLDLKERTRTRNTRLWITFDWGGIMDPLDSVQADENLLKRTKIEDLMLISDQEWDLKETIRDKNYELDRFEIDQDQKLAEDKVALGREKLSIRTATDEYILAVQLYDAQVKFLLQLAREYAAEVELEQLEVEKERTILAVEKEEQRALEINARIFYEQIARAQVEADLARAQLDVAKAHVRIVLSQIEAEQAELRIVEMELEKVMAEADKATLQADVANIWAEIVVKQLAEVRLDVQRREIEVGFEIIAAKLADVLNLWGARIDSEEVKTLAEKEVLAEIDKGLLADYEQEDLKLIEVQDTRENFDYERIETQKNISSESWLRDGLVYAKTMQATEKQYSGKARREKETWAERLLNTAREWTYKHQKRFVDQIDIRKEYISG